MDKHNAGQMERMGCVGTLPNPTSNIILFSIFLHSLYFPTDAQPVAIPCSVPRDNRTGLCYIPVRPTPARTFTDASEYCRTYVTGGYLARVHDSQTLSRILEHDILTAFAGKYWIGLGDPYEDGILSWSNEDEYAVGDYPPDDPPRWSAADTEALKGKCILYNNNVQREGSVWEAHDCNNLNDFICEFVGTSCDTLETYETAGLTHTPSAVPNRPEKIISYECEPGYARVTGQRQFLWECTTIPMNIYHPSNEYLPLCSAMTCDVTVTNGTVTLSGTTTVINQGTTGNLVVVTCEEGFEVSDPAELEVICISSTEWSTPRECGALDCDLTGVVLPEFLAWVAGPVANPKSGIDVETALGCADGYGTTWPPGQPSKMVCDDTMTWVNIPTCEPFVCGDISLNNGVLTLTDPAGVVLRTGEGFTVTCDDGYKKTGGAAADLVCLDNGDWGQGIACIAEDCNVGLTIAHAVQVTFAHGPLQDDLYRKTGGRVEVTCYEGYYLSPSLNPSTLLCNVDEVWDNKPSCEAYQCAGPLSIAHGTITPSDTAPTDTKVVVACDSGYQPLNVPNPSYYNILCGPNDEWTNPAVCQPNPCTDPTFPFAATVDFGGNSQSGVTPTVTCLAGYQLVDNVIPAANCAPDGTWTNPPSCQANLCGNLDGMTYNGVVTPETPRQSGDVFSGDVLTVTCNTGYNVPSGTTVVYCYPNGTWIQPVVCLGYPCNSTTISNVASLSFDPTPPRSGSQPAVLCQTGYSLTPSVLSPAMCQIGGNWTNRPQCLPNNCSSEYLTKEYVLNSVSVTFATFPDVRSGMVPHIVCMEGHSINTTSTVCLANGVWDNRPICSLGDCPGFVVQNALSAPSMGTFGVLDQVVCKQYYKPSVGNGTVLCKANKQWDPTVQCIPNMCLDAERAIPNTVAVTFTNDVLQTGHNVIMTCDVGYFQTSNNEPIHCESDGVWANKPVCYRTSCMTLAIVNGYVQMNGTLFGDAATVTCYEAYWMKEGMGTAWCEANGQWEPQHICEVNKCNPLSLAHGSVSQPNEVFSDVALTLTCDAGYVPEAFVTSLPFVVKCGINGQWINKPSCVLANSVTTCQAHGVTNVQTTPSQPMRNAQTTFTCNAGYMRTGPAAIRCSSTDGSWPQLPTCNANACNEIVVTNGQLVTDPLGTAHQTGVTFTVTCNNGYVKAGANKDAVQLVCSLNGTWSQDIVCNSNVCDGLLVVTLNLGVGSGQTTECLSCSECLTKYNANYPTILKVFTGSLPNDNTLDLICSRSTQYGACVLDASCTSVRPVDDVWNRERRLLNYTCNNRAGLNAYKSCIEQTMSSSAGLACNTPDNVVTIIAAGQPDKCSGKSGNFYTCLSTVLRGASSNCPTNIRTAAADWFDGFTTNADLVPLTLCGTGILGPSLLLVLLCSAVGIAGQYQF